MVLLAPLALSSVWISELLQRAAAGVTPDQLSSALLPASFIGSFPGDKASPASSGGVRQKIPVQKPAGSSCVPPLLFFP